MLLGLVENRDDDTVAALVLDVLQSGEPVLSGDKLIWFGMPVLVGVVCAVDGDVLHF